MGVGEDHREEWTRLSQAGVPHSRIARDFGVSRHTVTKYVGEPAKRPEKERKSVWVVPEWYENVVKIAKRYGLVNEHSEAVGEGSPARLLDEIGAGRIICSRPE